MKQAIIIRENRHYYLKGSCGPHNEITSLAYFLTSEIRTYPQRNREKFINYIIKGVTFEVYDTELVEGQIHFEYDFYGERDESCDFVLSPEQLKYILYKWWELTEAGYKEIIITKHDDCSYTLEGRNPEPIKEEKTSFFRRLVKKFSWK